MSLLMAELPLSLSPALVSRLGLADGRHRIGQNEDRVLWAGAPHILSVLQSPYASSCSRLLCSHPKGNEGLRSIKEGGGVKRAVWWGCSPFPAGWALAPGV